MNLRNALGWSTAQTIMRLGLGVISAKISAVYLGPPGVALVGQLTSFIQALQGTIGNAAGTAVVNLTATTRNDPVGLKNLWGTAFRLVVLIALMTLIVTAAGASPIAKWLLADGAYWPTIVLAASAVVLVVIDTIVTSALNGLRQPDLIAKTAIASSVVEVSTFVSLVYFFGHFIYHSECVFGIFDWRR